MSKNKLTKQQEAQIYCIKNGHAEYISSCFGYIHCGRCNEQIGDTLAGIFDTSEKILIKHDCEKCNKLKEKLNELDRKIISILEKTDNFPEYEKILSEVNFNE